MRVLIVTTFSDNHGGVNYYNWGQKLANGFTRLGHQVVKFDDRAMARAESMLGRKRFGRRAANSRLIETCRHNVPDMVVFCAADIITNETIEAIQSELPGSRYALVDMDPVLVPSIAQRIERFSGVVDAVFVTSAGEVLRRFANPRSKIHYLPNPVDPSLESMRSFAADHHEFDLFFAVREKRPSPRLDMMETIRSRFPDNALALHGDGFRPSIFGYAFIKTLGASRLGLNLSKFNDVYLYASARMAQYMGNGLAVLTPSSSGFSDTFEADDLLFYDDDDHLLWTIDQVFSGKINWRGIAAKGHQKVHEHFNERVCCQFIIDVINGGRLSLPYRFPTTAY